jgi:glycosyltransferase involved in cell wall biosynthesis
MAKLIDELSLFFPAYNEEENLQSTIEKALPVLQRIAGRFEILIVNDGSKDDTGRIARKLAAKDKHIRVIEHPVNRGYGAAFKSGLYGSKYSWIAFTDADGQFDFSEIINFINKQKATKADLVIGYYKKRQVPLTVVITSKMWELLVFILFGLHVRDIDCGFKMISKKVIDTIPKLQAERGAFISSEFLVKAKQSGFKITEVPVTHYPRLGGKATGRHLNVIIQSFVDLFHLRLKLQ